MRYGSIFKELLSPILLQDGFFRRGNTFYCYIPERQILKTITFEMLYGNRDFRIMADTISFAEGITMSVFRSRKYLQSIPMISAYKLHNYFISQGLIDKDEDNLNCVYTSNGQGGYTKTTYDDIPLQDLDVTPYTEEAFRRRMKENIDWMMSDLYPRLKMVSDIESCYEYHKYVYHRIFHEYAEYQNQLFAAVQLKKDDDIRAMMDYHVSLWRNLCRQRKDGDKKLLKDAQERLEKEMEYAERVLGNKDNWLEIELERRIEESKSNCIAFFGK